jgi:hypothetical protein
MSFRIDMKRSVLALSAAALALVAGLAGAQSSEEPRGSTPPGTSTDGSRPSDGAIKGGSIVPGETGGLPNSGRAGDAAERIKRCNELGGSLREDCLRRQQESSTGGASAPDKGGARTTPQRDAPPPQNPR